MGPIFPPLPVGRGVQKNTVGEWLFVFGWGVRDWECVSEDGGRVSGDGFSGIGDACPVFYKGEVAPCGHLVCVSGDGVSGHGVQGWGVL